MKPTLHLSTREPTSKRKLKLFSLALGSLLFIAAIVLSLPSKTVEQEIATALGCRTSATILIAEMQRDGSVRWSNGEVCSIEEAVRQLPDRLAKQPESVLAVKADKNTLMLTVYPLLDAAKDLGMQQAIFSVTDQGPVKIYRR